MGRRRGNTSIRKTQYRSGLEGVTAEWLRFRGIDPQYECMKIQYTVPEKVHNYTPDFVLPNGIIIETKGILDSDDRAKHLLIKDQWPDLDIRFVFSRSATPLYKGSPTTYAGWCRKYGFLFADRTIPDDWIDEPCKSKTTRKSSSS